MLTAMLKWFKHGLWTVWAEQNALYTRFLPDQPGSNQIYQN